MKVWHFASLYRIGLQLGRVWLWSGLLITDIKRMITAAPGNELDKTVHINISCCKKKGKCINFYLPISMDLWNTGKSPLPKHLIYYSHALNYRVASLSKMRDLISSRFWTSPKMTNELVIFVNIVPSNSPMPDGIKPSPQLVLTSIPSFWKHLSTDSVELLLIVCRKGLCKKQTFF